MQQISELNVDTTINELLNSELGFLLIKKDTKNEDVYEVLNKTGIVSDWTLRFVLTNNYHHIVFHFFPLLYSETDNMEKPLSQSLATIRSMAIKNLFLRWTEVGHNKSHAKDPFKSKSFMKYINDLSFTDADTGTTIYYHEVVGKVLELIGKINTEDVSKKKTDKSEVVKDINDTTIERERY